MGFEYYGLNYTWTSLATQWPDLSLHFSITDKLQLTMGYTAFLFLKLASNSINLNKETHKHDVGLETPAFEPWPQW